MHQKIGNNREKLQPHKKSIEIWNGNSHYYWHDQEKKTKGGVAQIA